MTEEAPVRGAASVASLDDYERRLRTSMQLMPKATRESVVREIVAGVDAQLQAVGGDFARAAPLLDDPAWVGRQMVRVYGVAGWVKAAAVVFAALLALVSVPGVAAQPADEGLATALGLLAFAALVILLFFAATRLSGAVGATAGSVAAAVRLLGFLLPRDGFSPAQTASGGEMALFLLATALIIVVAVVPALAARARGESTDA
jgi:hypothetical protein